MNYNFPLDQLKKFHDGDLTDLRLAHIEREVQKMELLVDNKNDKEKISYPSTWKLKEKPGISGNFCGSPSGDNTRFCHTFSSALWYSG
jgi:hypothetical protein